MHLAVQVDEALGVVVRAEALTRGRRAAQIAEAAQGPALRLGDLAAARRPVRLAGDRRRQLRRPAALAPEQVARLGRIGGQLVELGERQRDQLVTSPEHPAQRRPAAVEGGGERLEVDRRG